MIRRQQSGAARDDAVTVVIGITGEGDVEAVLEPDQAMHGVRGGGVHADLAVPVDAHEPESGVDTVVHDLEIETVTFSNPGPVAHARTAERIDAHAQFRVANDLHVDDIAEFGNVSIEIIVFMRGWRLACGGQRHALDATQVCQQTVRLGFDDAGDLRIRRSAVGGVVLEAAVVGWIVRGRDDDAVGEPILAPLVVNEDGVRNRRRRRVFVTFGDHDLDVVGSQHFERAGECRRRKCMGVEAQEQWPGDALLLAISADGLGDGQHMRLVEAAFE